MWQTTDLCKEYQSLTAKFTEHATVLKAYSVSFRDDFPKAIVNFQGYMEHIEKTPLEQADAGHLMHYYNYLKKNLIDDAEDWIRRVLFTPLDMFLNFLYGTGYCPSEPIRTAA